MVCPNCKSVRIDVESSRPVQRNGNNAIRRRRVCDACKHKWVTIEVELREGKDGRVYTIAIS